MRTLAIDYGEKRIGIAISDAGGKLATPLEVIQAPTPELAIDRILQIARREGAAQLLIGLPLNMDGSAGPAARNATRWGRELSAKSSLPVLFVDERLSSFQAEQTLRDRKAAGEKLTRKKKKQRLDALAAAGFLQAYLDGKLAPIGPD